MDAVEKVLAALEARGCRPKPEGMGYKFLCPAHSDKNASATLARGDDGRALLHCHAGCSYDAIIGALGLAATDLFNDAKPEKRIVAEYDYRDESGDLLYQVVRFQPKDFRQRRTDGNGGWTWKIGDCRRVLYMLPELIGAVSAGETVYICEGEKDADAINETEGQGYIATTNAGGAGKWRPEYSIALSGANVRIIADKDEPGRRHATDVAFHLKELAASVEIVEAKTGKDVHDHLAAGHGLHDLVKTWPPEPPPREALRIICPFDALTREPEPIPWVIPGWLTDGERLLLGGEWSTGKSVVALDLSIALATSGMFLGMIKVPCPVRRVLYVDEENGTALARRRMKQILLGKGVTTDQAKAMPFRYLSKNALTFASVTGNALFLREVEEFQPNWIVLDSAIRFFPGDNENSNSQWASFIALHVMPHNAKGVGFVLLDHMRKPTKGDDDLGHRVRGAGDKLGSVDEAWCIVGDRHTNARTMSHERTRWDEYQPPLQLLWQTSEDKESAWLDAKPEKQGCEDLIRSRLEVVGSVGISRQDLIAQAEAAGYTDRALEKAIKSMKSSGFVKQAKDGGRAVRLWGARWAPSEAA